MIIKGDINEDGRITLRDLELMEALLNGGLYIDGSSISERAFEAADIFSDGTLDDKDLTPITLHILGKEIINEVIE